MVAVALLCHCSPSEDKNDSDKSTDKFGYYEILFDLGEVQCPTRWDIQADKLSIINADERIVVSDYSLRGDSGSFTLPVFNTTVDFHFDSSNSLKGIFKNQYRKGDYKVPFVGHLKTEIEPGDLNKQLVYDVTEGPHSKRPSKSIGIFNFYDTKITGTFLTQVGDYRFLEGQKLDDDSFYLSCFDGSHLFYFSATMEGDSVEGRFYSGNHWNTGWNGKLDHSASLSHPDSLTYLNEGFTSVGFQGLDHKGKLVEFQSQDFDKVTLIQILGTWCPNCMDETRYYKSLKEKYGDRIDIIGLAYERKGDNTDRLNAIKTYIQQMEITYPIYLCGTDASKDEASDMFSELNEITSFPTTIFLDKHGMVRKIHTGFYGPGTGDYYTEYTQETESFLDSLIKED